MYGSLKTPESDFLASVLVVAKLHGWEYYHPRPGNARGHWATHADHSRPGFPDLVLAHKERGIIFAELKSETGRMSAGQKIWARTLLSAGIEWYLWRPSDMAWISERLGSTWNGSRSRSMSQRPSV